LDAEGSEALNQAVRGFKSTARPVIIMTHRPMAIAECDRLVVVDGGRIKADGPRDEILKSSLKNKDQVQQTLRQGGTA
jgi:ATP-binding cassette subfamily C protein